MGELVLATPTRAALTAMRFQDGESLARALTTRAQQAEEAVSGLYAVAVCNTELRITFLLVHPSSSAAAGGRSAWPAGRPPALVGSSVALPLVEMGAELGRIQLYSTVAHAFEGRAELIQRIFGPQAVDRGVEADPIDSVMDAARQTPSVIVAEERVEEAVSVVMGSEGLDPRAARGRLEALAQRGGTDVDAVARGLLDSHRRRP